MSDFTEPPSSDCYPYCEGCQGDITQGECVCGPSADDYCDTTGDLREDCPCSDCYYERHGEPKPCGQCGGVGGHLEGCY